MPATLADAPEPALRPPRFPEQPLADRLAVLVRGSVNRRPSMWLTGVAIAVAVLGAVAAELSAAGASTSGAHRPHFSSTQVRHITKIVRSGMSSQRLPGVNVGIWVPGRGRYVRSFGTANRRSGTPMRGPDHVRIASVTKTFTGVTVLRLVDRGRLGLGDRLNRFVKGIPNGREITVRQLLGMTSGVYDFTSNKRFSRQFGRNLSFHFTTKDFLRIQRRHRPSFRPGKKVQYADSNYFLLGMIIHKVTGHSPAHEIYRQVIRPLHLHHTSYPTSERIPKPRARGYFAGNNGNGKLRDYTTLNPGVPRTAGAMISRRSDLRVWAKALATGRLLEQATHRKQHQFRTIPNPALRLRYGLGLVQVGDFIGHDGAIFGYSTAMFYLPRARATIIVVGNKSTNFSQESTNIFVAVGKYLFPNAFPR